MLENKYLGTQLNSKKPTIPKQYHLDHQIKHDLNDYTPLPLPFLITRATRDPAVTIGNAKHLNVFITLFGALYGGGVHSLGLIQAVDSMLLDA